MRPGFTGSSSRPIRGLPRPAQNAPGRSSHQRQPLEGQDGKMEIDTHVEDVIPKDVGETSEHVFSSTFNDPSADIVIKSSDNVLFRVASHHLKSNSGFFCDMIMDSGFTSSVDNPIILEEHATDIKTILIIIAGRPCHAEDRFDDWKTSKRLYLLMQKYQLDRVQAWFSIFAGKCADEAPFEALCLACNNPCFDETLAESAILYGIKEETTDSLFDPTYFVDNYASKSTKDDDRKLRVLDPTNTKVKLSLDLGYKGFVAYCQAFSKLKRGEVDWQSVADRFVDTVREVERKRGMRVRVPSDKAYSPSPSSDPVFPFAYQCP